MKYLNNWNLNQNELQNVRIQNLAIDPASPVPGQIYYNTVSNTFRGWNALVWLNLGPVLDGTAVVALINSCSNVIEDKNLSSNVADAILKKHAHANQEILDSITAAFTTAQESKLALISPSANNYSLPVATATLGGVKSGTDISVDASGNVSLVNTPVTPGTYPKMTVDAKGRVTAGMALIASDIPSLLHSAISDFDTQVRLSTLNQMAVPTSLVNMNGQRVVSVATPLMGNDAVNKDYVDNARAGLSVKDPVKVATTANINLATGGLLTVDGVTLVDGNRVLVINQSLPKENGIYIAHTGAWVRSSDSDNTPTGEVVNGMATWVDQGTTMGNSRWVLTTADPITLGTTALAFSKDFQASDVTTGTGLKKIGNQIAMDVSGVTAGTYSKVTVDATGRVTVGAQITSSDIGLANVENKSSSTIRSELTASNVTTALGYTPVKKFAANIGDGSAVSITITHNLNTLDVDLSMREVATNNAVMTDWCPIDVNNIKLTFAIAPTSAQYRVVVTG